MIFIFDILTKLGREPEQQLAVIYCNIYLF